MSAAPKLLPDPKPLTVDRDGERFIRHPVLIAAYPVQYRHVVREVWDALIDQDRDNATILSDRLTDRVLSQLTGLSPRGVQDGLYFLELGPAACHVLIGIERRLRRNQGERDALARRPELCTTDADHARLAELVAERDRLRADLVEFRQSRDDLKARYRQLTSRMVMILSNPDPTDADHARLAELVAERAAVRALLEAPDSLIFRHSGPGFDGLRQIEITARLAGGKKKPHAGAAKGQGKGKGDDKAGRKASYDRQIPNGIGAVQDCTPEQVAANLERMRAREAEAEAAADVPVPMTPEQQADFDRFFGPAAKERREAQRRSEERDREAAQRLADKRRPKSGPGAPGDVPTIQAFVDRAARERGIPAPPDPHDTS
jgi:hypothetical protein